MFCRGVWMHEVVVADARGHGPDLLLSRIFATGGIRTTDQIFAEVVLLLGKTTRLVSPRGDASRVVFPNKRTTSAVSGSNPASGENS